MFYCSKNFERHFSGSHAWLEGHCGDGPGRIQGVASLWCQVEGGDEVYDEAENKEGEDKKGGVREGEVRR